MICLNLINIIQQLEDAGIVRLKKVSEQDIEMTPTKIFNRFIRYTRLLWRFLSDTDYNNVVCSIIIKACYLDNDCYGVLYALVNECIYGKEAEDKGDFYG